MNKAFKTGISLSSHLMLMWQILTQYGLSSRKRTHSVSDYRGFNLSPPQGLLMGNCLITLGYNIASRRAAFPGRFHFSLSQAPELLAYGPSSTKEASAEERGVQLKRLQLIHHFELDICFDEYNYHDSLQTYLMRELEIISLIWTGEN